MLHTTLQLLKENNACKDGYEKLLKHIGLKYPKDKPIELTTILKSNDLDDTLWSLRATLPEERDALRKLAWSFIADCFEGKDGNLIARYEKLNPKDKNPRKAIEACREYAAGKITVKALKEALDLASTSAYAYASAYASAYAYAYAYASAYASASAYAYASASAEERKWQTKRLTEYLEGKQ